MRKELRRSLFAAAIASVALAGCGGGGGGGSPAPSPAPSPSPSPPPPPPSAGSYFLVGVAGGAAQAGTSIPFADLEPPADPTGAGQAPGLYGIQFVDPVNQPVPYDVGQGKAQLAPGGTALPLATVSEYFVSGNSITAWGTRYLVYASATSNGSGLLYAIDLRKSGATPANPAPVQLSSATVAGAQLCSTPPVVFDNYAAANLSWIQFRVLGNDHNCGTLDDKFAIFQMSMNSATAPVSLGPIAQVELVQPIYNASGTITGFLAINHPATDPTTGFPQTPVPLQQYDATNLANPPKTFATMLAGNGHNVASGDFLSLGITSGNVWLYWDYNGVYGLNLGTGAISQIQALTGGDRVDNGAVFDGTNVYVPIDNTNGTGAWILQINESSLAPTPGPRDNTLATIRLVGETTGALVYFGGTVATPVVTNLWSAPKSTLVRNAQPLSNTVGGTKTIDSPMGLNASTAPVAFLVGETVFFTIADSSASGSTGFAKQAFYVSMNSSGAPGPTSPVGSVSAVLGAVAPASIPTSGTVANVGALVISMGANALPAFPGTTGGGDFEIGSGGSSPTLVTSASLDLYNAAGVAGAHIGSLGTISPLTGNAVTLPASPVYWAALASGPVQAGMPAMLQLTGSAGNSPAEDIAVITPDTASTLSQDSDFAQ